VQAKILSIALTNKLHSYGYTTSYVKQYHLDGEVCILYIVESHIADIQITADSDVKESIIQDLQKLQGAVYNKNAVHVILSQLKEKYVLDTIKVNVVNYSEGDDVQLIVMIRAKTLMYSLEVATAPIYGITPSLMLSVPFYQSIATLQGQIGFNDKIVTVKKGLLDYLHHSGAYGCHLGMSISQEYAVWERYAADFTLTMVRPFLGIGMFHSVGVFDISSFIYGVAAYFRVSEYENTILKERLPATCNNTGVELRVNVTDSRSIVKKNKNFTISIFNGISDEEYVFTTHLSLYAPIPVTTRLYIIPSGYSFHTTSGNRLNAEYVFDSYLLGYSDKYTATLSRHITGIQCMYEVIYEMLFLHIFGNIGVYKDEYNHWSNVSNYGLMIDVYYHSAIINIGCAWNSNEIFNNYYIYSGVKASW